MSVVWLDCRPGGAWAQGHVTGALDADLDRYLSTASDPGFDPAVGGRHPLPPLDRWRAQLGAWGVGPETLVVVYDGARGAQGACRAWWMLRAVGHRRVSVLHEPLEALPALRGWTTEAGPRVEAREAYPATAWAWPVLAIDEAAAWVADPERVLFDVRSPERWRGEVEPLDPVAGRIPGSRNLPLASCFDASGAWLDEAGLGRSLAPALAGLSPDRVAVHCGSGVSACVLLYAFKQLGWGGIPLYVGSYSQWCRSGRPLGRGAE